MCTPAPIEIDLLAGQFEHSCFPVWLVDSRLDVVSVNPCARELYPANCLTDGVRVLFSPPDAEEVRRCIRDGVSLMKRPSLLARQGVALSFSPYLTPQGERGATVLLSPVPEAVSAEADLRQGLEEIGSLAITQGLRKCMSDVFYALSACNAKLKSAGIGLVDEQLRQISHSCYQIMRTAGNLSEKIRLSAGIDPARRTVNFWDCCAELMDACGTLLRGAKRDFSYSLPHSAVYLDCDFDRIAAALLNLISNAYLYGGPEVRLSITGRDLSDRVLLTVSDDGPGLPDVITQRLFQPFCSWECLDLENAGAGLGLHLVRSIVTQAGGGVTVNSGEHGTTVAISLPMSSQAPQENPGLGSSSLVYLQDRFSPLYFGLCDIVRLPDL